MENKGKSIAMNNAPANKGFNEATLSPRRGDADLALEKTLEYLYSEAGRKLSIEEKTRLVNEAYVGLVREGFQKKLESKGDIASSVAQIKQKDELAKNVVNAILPVSSKNHRFRNYLLGGFAASVIAGAIFAYNSYVGGAKSSTPADSYSRVSVNRGSGDVRSSRNLERTVGVSVNGGTYIAQTASNGPRE